MTNRKIHHTAVHLNATTMSPEIISYTITENGSALIQKTELVVIEPGGKRLVVYRKSGSEPGCYTQDIYSRDHKRWKSQGKKPGKVLNPPYPFAAAPQYDHKNVKIWSPVEPTEAEQHTLIESIRSDFITKP